MDRLIASLQLKKLIILLDRSIVILTRRVVVMAVSRLVSTFSIATCAQGLDNLFSRLGRSVHDFELFLVGTRICMCDP